MGSDETMRVFGVIVDFDGENYFVAGHDSRLYTVAVENASLHITGDVETADKRVEVYYPTMGWPSGVTRLSEMPHIRARGCNE